MTDVKWLESLCSTDPDRPYLHRPFTASISPRRPYTVACNGPVAVIVPGRYGYARGRVKMRAIVEAMGHMPLGTDVSLDTLRAWAGLHVPIPNGGIRPGMINDVYINRNLFALLLRVLPGRTATVTTRGKLEGIGLAGAGWWAVVMPLNASNCDESERRRAERHVFIIPRAK